LGSRSPWRHGERLSTGLTGLTGLTGFGKAFLPVLVFGFLVPDPVNPVNPVEWVFLLAAKVNGYIFFTFQKIVRKRVPYDKSEIAAGTGL
jgi:hypothetical protein